MIQRTNQTKKDEIPSDPRKERIASKNREEQKMKFIGACSLTEVGGKFEIKGARTFGNLFTSAGRS